MEVLIITGQSGAGKSMAVNYLEDNGYYCIDNLPPLLIKSFIALIKQGRQAVEKSAFIIDIRNGNFLEDLSVAMEELDREGIKHRILFLWARNEVLLRRFAETRRIHPLGFKTTNEVAIMLENERLAPIRKIADMTVDTSEFKSSAQLNEALAEVLGDAPPSSEFKLVVKSFGFKYGLPVEMDMMHDVRFIPNPFYVADLKYKTGNDIEVQDFVMNSDVSHFFLNHVIEMIDKLIPAYIKEDKHSLTVAFGCTGGQHRSVTMANKVFEDLNQRYRNVVLIHRDI
ncbi:MAG: RNase adapter RapZ [Clostridiales Family XIII bacterium]|jgi:UPF0042 nucleotide-binding protein|nr:RNase adapter RapZ [Clostridiales Family XIII bacterium]